MTVRLICESPAKKAQFAALIQRFQLAEQGDANLALVLTAQRLELRKLDETKLGPIYVDFIQGSLAYRRQFGGGRGEMIAKAVGIKKGDLPTIIDATAGLGRDAFVLASLGCHVMMIERNPVVAALLEDGLQRAYQDHNIGHWLTERLTLHYGSSTNELAQLAKADTVYLDPMFPHRNKSALVKKEMRVFQTLVGADLDADQLLTPARQLASKRVVVKRPSYAAFLNGSKPTLSMKSKNHRFDIYLNT